MVLFGIFLMGNDAEDLFMCLSDEKSVRVFCQLSNWNCWSFLSC